MALSPGKINMTCITILVPDNLSDGDQRVGAIIRAGLLAHGHMTIQRTEVEVKAYETTMGGG